MKEPVFIRDKLSNVGRIVECIPQTGMAYVPDDKPIICYILTEKISVAPRKESFTAKYLSPKGILQGVGKEGKGNGDSEMLSSRTNLKAGIDMDIVKDMMADGKARKR
jgi:hypothetical protein